MNERYLYKGKDLDNKNWIEGGFYLDEDNDGLIYSNIYESPYFVLKETVCQFTGFKAKNRKRNLDERIWENDVFRETEERDEGDINSYYVVMWVKEYGAFSMVPVGAYEMLNNGESISHFPWLFEDAFLNDFSLDVGLTKVGNVFDTPQFLK